MVYLPSAMMQQDATPDHSPSAAGSSSPATHELEVKDADRAQTENEAGPLGKGPAPNPSGAVPMTAKGAAANGAPYGIYGVRPASDREVPDLADEDLALAGVQPMSSQQRPLQ